MRHRTKLRTLPLGSISHGTLRPVDLAEACIDAASVLSLEAKDRKVFNSARRELNKHFIDADNSDEAVSEIYDELFTILSNYTPPFTYFGMNEGDGSDLGVWIDWHSIQDAEHSGAAKKGDTLPAAGRGNPPLFIVVNDHGNMTLYRHARTRWVELWSVV